MRFSQKHASQIFFYKFRVLIRGNLLLILRQHLIPNSPSTRKVLLFQQLSIRHKDLFYFIFLNYLHFCCSSTFLSGQSLNVVLQLRISLIISTSMLQKTCKQNLLNMNGLDLTKTTFNKAYFKKLSQLDSSTIFYATNGNVNLSYFCRKT